jgi:hypothetical protein
LRHINHVHIVFSNYSSLQPVSITIIVLLQTCSQASRLSLNDCFRENIL